MNKGILQKREELEDLRNHEFPAAVYTAVYSPPMHMYPPLPSPMLQRAHPAQHTINKSLNRPSTRPLKFSVSSWVIYYSKFAKDQLFDIAYFSPIS